MSKTLLDTGKKYWPSFAYLAAGVLLAVISGLIAQRSGLGAKLELDLQGVKTAGTAEPTGESGEYHLRYKDPSGTIHRHKYSGRLAGEFGEDGVLNIIVVYNPVKPHEFQPVGVSYLPGVCAAVTFAVALTCVFRARRGFRSMAKIARPKEK